MKLNVLASGSSGNSYILENDNEALIIEAGVPFLEVKKAMNFNIRKIVGCVISHEHFDHAKYISQYMKSGIPVYSAFQTQSALEISTGELTKAIPPQKKHKIGNFTVTPFNVPHDEDIECYGYLIQHDDIGKLLFMTDLQYCPYSFRKQNVNHILCECNHSDTLLYDAYEGEVRNRVMKTHMGLQAFLRLISTNDNKDLQNVVLLHLSNYTSDTDLFRSETQKITSANVYIAEKGLQIQLNNDVPF